MEPAWMALALALSSPSVALSLAWTRFAIRRAWSRLLRILEQVLSRPYRPRMAFYATGGEGLILKRPEVDYIPPSRRLVYATALCLLALASLCSALIICVLTTGRVPGELLTAIVGLASTLAGIFIGRRGGDLD